MKLLIVEDEPVLRAALKKGFLKMGYAVDVAPDGEVAVETWMTGTYDALILDLNLPRIDGLDVLKHVRFHCPEANIIVLSARNEVEDRILGLDCGANDYMGKPFHFKELEARVRALLRRSFETKDSLIHCKYGVSIDTARKSVYVHSDYVNLTRKEYGILQYLALYKSKVISSEEIIEHVWESEHDLFSNAFKVHLCSLRKKLPKGLIRTIRGEGYYVE